MLYFLNNRGKKTYKHIFISCVTFVLIFKFILVYLLHVLLVFKIKVILKKKNSTQKCAERGSFLYILYRLKILLFLEEARQDSLLIRVAYHSVCTLHCYCISISYQGCGPQEGLSSSQSLRRNRKWARDACSFCMCVAT